MYAPHQLNKTQNHGNAAVQAALYTVIHQTKARTLEHSLLDECPGQPSRIIHNIFSLSNDESEFRPKIVYIFPARCFLLSPDPVLRLRRTCLLLIHIPLLRPRRPWYPEEQARALALTHQMA